MGGETLILLELLGEPVEKGWNNRDGENYESNLRPGQIVIQYWNM
ncbi:30553_t:CDS:1, partial [Racocetra persica]